MKILGILGSPDPRGGSAQLLLTALKAAEKEGLSTEVVRVYEREIKPCMGCIRNEEPKCKFPCIFEDYGKELLVKIYNSDGLILSTPIYWFGPSGPLKLLVDRMTCLENMISFGEPSYMEGKVVGVIAVGADAGAIFTGAYLITTLNSMGAIVPPWALAYSYKSKKAIFDKKAVMDALNIGILTAKTIKLLKGEKQELRYIQDEELYQKIKEEVIKTLELYPEEIYHEKRPFRRSSI
ncbi:MAG: flavodoxin family protein [Thermodesulfobacteriaceae bacterium]|nr:flavodoxin family protein [Thermodesulfobacteriaceae bacterium]MCX8042348.1 flavodoxin family protein [Thermodesulfobacteriaceae bacterium]MDW8136678.1 flavodoxin family protein [Thermodesulfobacterium sp.]